MKQIMCNPSPPQSERETGIHGLGVWEQCNCMHLIITCFAQFTMSTWFLHLSDPAWLNDRAGDTGFFLKPSSISILYCSSSCSRYGFKGNASKLEEFAVKDTRTFSQTD